MSTTPNPSSGTPNRQPKGTPVGGQFAPASNPESETELESPLSTEEQFFYDNALSDMNANWPHSPAVMAMEVGRKNASQELAAAEQWVKEIGVVLEWSHDGERDEEFCAVLIGGIQVDLVDGVGGADESAHRLGESISRSRVERRLVHGTQLEHECSRVRGPHPPRRLLLTEY